MANACQSYPTLTRSYSYLYHHRNKTLLESNISWLWHSIKLRNFRFWAACFLMCPIPKNLFGSFRYSNLKLNYFLFVGNLNFYKKYITFFQRYYLHVIRLFSLFLSSFRKSLLFKFNINPAIILAVRLDYNFKNKCSDLKRKNMTNACKTVIHV